MQVTINDTINRRLQDLKQIWRRHNKLNRTLKQELRALTDRALRNTSEILKSVKGINRRAEHVDMSHHIHRVREYGYWRYGHRSVNSCEVSSETYELHLCRGKTAKRTTVFELVPPKPHVHTFTGGNSHCKFEYVFRKNAFRTDLDIPGRLAILSFRHPLAVCAFSINVPVIQSRLKKASQPNPPEREF